MAGPVDVNGNVEVLEGGCKKGSDRMGYLIILIPPETPLIPLETLDALIPSIPIVPLVLTPPTPFFSLRRPDTPF